jgi:alpha-beta hydrolase superfamily lysophospholipase
MTRHRNTPWTLGPGSFGSLVAAVVAGCAVTTFVLRMGKDTVAVERFTRSGDRLEGELLIKVASARFRYLVEFDARGLPSRTTNRYWAATDSAGAAPKQTAVVTFADTTAVIEITGPDGPAPTQRLPSKRGAFVHLNPSFAMWEPILAWAKRSGSATVSVFALAGGQTFDAKITFPSADSVVIDVPGGAMRLAVSPDGRLLGGYLAAQNLTLERSETAAIGVLGVEKPDYSAPPGAPYTAENVTVPTPMGHTLAGTLTVPKFASRTRRVPAVVTITGSGGQDRDEAIVMFKGFRPYREFADSLGRRGIAVLRMDDRGVGESGGNPTTATSADFAQDIRAGLAYLRTRPEIDGSRLGLIGHSEGGIIAPMVALEEPALKGIVLLAGTSRSGRTILDFQLRNLINGNATLTPTQKDSALGAVAAQIDSIGTQPWMRFFLDHDPSVVARRVTTPVLVLNGETDQQVTPDQVPELVTAFKAAGNTDVTSHVFPKLNHLFVVDSSGFPGNYTNLKSFQVHPSVIRMVADWLAKRFRSGTS